MAKNGEQRKVVVDMDRVTFGVEIECMLPSQYVRDMGIRVGSYHRGMDLPAPFPMGWNAQSDSSIHAVDGTRGIEIVSPKLTGTAGLMTVLQVFSILNEAGAQVNKSCGFHVHVGIKSVLGNRANDDELVVRWIRRMLHLVSHHEAALIAITGRPSRWRNDYCMSVKPAWDGLETTTSIDTLRERIRRDTRYRTLNLQNIGPGRKNTVEFRLFGATLNGIQAIGYIVTAMGIAHRAAQCGTVKAFDAEVRPVSAGDWEIAVKALHTALDKFGWPTGSRQLWGRVIRAEQRKRAGSFVEAMGR